MASIIFVHVSGSINDPSFWVLTIATIVLATLVGIYRYVNNPLAHGSKKSHNER